MASTENLYTDGTGEAAVGAASAVDAVVSCEMWAAAAELCAEDVAFFHMDNDAPKLALLMNDTFHYASADAEVVEWKDMLGVYDTWKQEGIDGLIRWAAAKRGCEPLPGVLSS